MLIAKNQSRKFFLNQPYGWLSLKDVEESLLDGAELPNANAGIALRKGERAGMLLGGVAYETASGRRIYSFHDLIILEGMDESENFRSVLEEFFGVKFTPTEEKFEIVPIYINRRIKGSNLTPRQRLENSLIKSIFKEIAKGIDLGVGKDLSFRDERVFDLLYMCFRNEGQRLLAAESLFNRIMGRRSELLERAVRNFLKKKISIGELRRAYREYEGVIKE